MKKKITYVLSFCFLVILSASCSRREIRNIGAKGKNVICFGDSITFGIGAVPGYGYPADLSLMMSLPVINAGIEGEPTSEAVRRLKADVLDRNPLLVIIEFGGNDFLRKVPAAETLDNIRKMVDMVQAAGAMVAIADIGGGGILDDYHRLFYNLAIEKNTIFIPGLLNGILTSRSLKSDPIHPNADGYKIIAHRVYRAILPSLNQNHLIKSMAGEK
jgi:acyl-CoA thioesterase I